MTLHQIHQRRVRCREVTCEHEFNKSCGRFVSIAFSAFPTKSVFLTVEFDTELVGGPSKGHAAGGGRAWEGGAAEEDVGGEHRLSYRVAQRGKALSTVDALVRQSAMERATAAERLARRRFLPVLRRIGGWKR